MRPDLTLDDLAGFLPAPGADDDKYSRGVVGLAVGSEEYPGAAVLAAEAALRTGCGMARLIAPAQVASLVLHRRPEVVTMPGRMDALVIGSGLPDGSSADVTARLALCELFETSPRIIDAGALADTPHIGGPRILTPHAGEVTRLAESLQLPGDTPHAWAEALAAHWSVVVLLKGHRPGRLHPVRCGLFASCRDRVAGQCGNGRRPGRRDGLTRCPPAARGVVVRGPRSDSRRRGACSSRSSPPGESRGLCGTSGASSRRRACERTLARRGDDCRAGRVLGRLCQKAPDFLADRFCLDQESVVAKRRGDHGGVIRAV